MGGTQLVSRREVLIANSGGGIYKLVLKQHGTAEPQRLAVPANFQCNNDKALSPDGKKIAFSTTVPAHKGSQVFLADARWQQRQAGGVRVAALFSRLVPDNKTLAFVAQRNGSGQYDIYGMPADGGVEKQLTSNIHHDDGPDYSPNGKWIYINSDRSGKEAVWRFPSDGAGTNDAKAEMVVSDGLEDWFPTSRRTERRWCISAIPPVRLPTTRALFKLSSNSSRSIMIMTRLRLPRRRWTGNDERQLVGS